MDAPSVTRAFNVFSCCFRTRGYLVISKAFSITPCAGKAAGSQTYIRHRVKRFEVLRALGK